MHPLTFAVFLICCLGISAPGYAFRCGSHLISTGEHLTEVMKKCGDPTHVEQWIDERVFTDRVLVDRFYNNRAYTDHSFRNRHLFQLLQSADIAQSLVQLWTYNLGTRRFMRQLRFENGILKKIDTL